MNWIRRESHNENIDGEKNYPFARLMSWLFLTACIMLLIYTYYRAEIGIHPTSFVATKSGYYFKYYLISLTGILFWGLVLRLREGIRANIVMVASSLVVGLYLFEGGLTFFNGFGQEKPNIYLARIAAAADLGIAKTSCDFFISCLFCSTLASGAFFII